MENKEPIYDSQIAPLMAQIIAICKEHKIPFFATFEYWDGDFCTSGGRQEGHPIFDWYAVLKQCAGNGEVNVDKLMLWVMKAAAKTGHSSIILSRLGVPVKPKGA